MYKKLEVFIKDFLYAAFCSILSFTLVIQPTFVYAGGSIIADTNKDGSRPHIDKTHSGVDKINLLTPNSAGVSHNVFVEFNVNENGLILNNSPLITSTHLSGQIEGNPNLQIGGEASLILNEITGFSLSALDGYIEIAGKKADIVIANENGITCNGCGFINTDRATLTTGKPTFSTDGSLGSFLILNPHHTSADTAQLNPCQNLPIQDSSPSVG